MYYCRVLVFVMLLVFTSAAVCSSLFPVFRNDMPLRRDHVYYWYEEHITESWNSITQGIWRMYTRDYGCDLYATYFVIVCIMSVAGTVCAGIATMLALVHLTINVRWILATCIAFLTFVAFATFTVCVALVSYMYTHDACMGSVYEMKAFKTRGYALVEGFGLMVTACGGLLLCFIFTFCT